MLFGNIDQLDLVPYISTRLRSLIIEAVTLAQKNEEDGKYPLSKEDVFVMLVSTQTEPLEEKVAEIHKHYIDVQILLSGAERLGYSNNLNNVHASLTELENDVLFVDEVQHENFVDLHSGDFVVFYPNQIHRPLCAITEASSIRKAVLKIPFEFLNS
ncbi:YhcH/YjgK/YiaL family protein [Aliivibrio kagoshimensis]|uniref:YhcH/YjgK/YiaL family protein n=1 Tax=Aliivibrio kagoshimensis TaxID=2910230 RepID=UPI003D0FD433